MVLHRVLIDQSLDFTWYAEPNFGLLIEIKLFG